MYECIPVANPRSAVTLAGYRHRTDTPLERIKVYARGGLRFLEKDGKDYTYEAMLESILADIPGKPKYVVMVSGGNDVYGPKKTGYEEEYEDVQVVVAMAKFAARLWYQRIPGLIVFGGSSDCFLYEGQKAEVFDRRVKSVRRLAQRMFAACRLPCRVVSGVKELLPLKAHVVDGIGHYQGTPHAYDSFTRALAEFCMLAPGYSGPRRSRL